MWQILKAELSYNRVKIILMYLFCAVCFITIWIGVKYERNVVPLTMLIMVVPAITICLDSEAKRSKENRFAFLISKPMRVQSIDLSRLLIPVVLWMTVMILYLVMYGFHQSISHNVRKSPSIIQIIFLNGVILTIVSLYYINKDLRTFFIARTPKVFIMIFWVVMYIAILSPPFILSDFLGLFGQNLSIQEFLLNVSESPNALLIFNLIGVVCSIISTIVFKYRSSYIE
jgi:hypothetical protein